MQKTEDPPGGKVPRPRRRRVRAIAVAIGIVLASYLVLAYGVLPLVWTEASAVVTPRWRACPRSPTMPTASRAIR